MTFTNELIQSRLLCILRAPRPDNVADAAEALAEAGMRLIEVTYTIPHAAEVIGELRRRIPHALVGAGTITTEADIADATTAGAQFLVSPGLTETLAAHMSASGIPFVPGAFSPSEVMRAHATGAAAVKLFPAACIGPRFLADIRAPLPQVPLVPTGGLSLDQVSPFLRAGAAAVGLGSGLCSGEDIQQRRWDQIRSHARRALQAVAHAQQ